ncbi:hypothetical protein [Endozoicomonas ascidiicola]|uniref:hypothetical protein n=1 Tax=Endozoicomonas ascidiicola TaxID=1698521 RepID=UPI001FDFAE41|nr:hypothetical protein [Endozoicomonas ascidiicola]
MIKNNLKALIESNITAINGWLVHPSPSGAELMAHQGYDALTIDMQHGMMGFDTALAMLQAISTTSVTPSGSHSLAGTRHHYEDAGCRCLRHHLSDDRNG